MSVRPELWTVNCRTGKRVSWPSTACSFCDRSANVLSVSYTVHICFVRYTSATRTFVDCLFGTYALLRLPRRSSPPLRRLSSQDKHFFAFFFCPVGVRYSTITCTQKASGANFIKGLRRFCLKTQYVVRMLKIGFSSTVCELCEVLTFCRIFKSNV